MGLARDHHLKPAQVREIVLRFPRSGTHMIDNNELKSHCAQYILPVGLVYASIVEVTTTNGRRLTRRVDHARGTMENPLTPEEIHQKYLTLATTATSAAHAGRIADVVRRIERLSNLDGLAIMLRNLPAAAPGRGVRKAAKVRRAKAARPRETASGTRRKAS